MQEVTRIDWPKVPPWGSPGRGAPQAPPLDPPRRRRSRGGASRLQSPPSSRCGSPAGRGWAGRSSPRWSMPRLLVEEHARRLRAIALVYKQYTTLCRALACDRLLDLSREGRGGPVGTHITPQGPPTSASSRQLRLRGAASCSRPGSPPRRPPKLKQFHWCFGCFFV